MGYSLVAVEVFIHCRNTRYLPERRYGVNNEEKGMNYLIVEDFSGQPVPFVFPRRVDHSDMREQLPYGQILAGGTVELHASGFVCSGGNAELGVKARPKEDADIIANALRVR
jgi:hypothetical protein